MSREALAYIIDNTAETSVIKKIDIFVLIYNPDCMEEKTHSYEYVLASNCGFLS